MPNQDANRNAEKGPSFDFSFIFDSLALQFPVCMASNEFHFFPQARANTVDWFRWDDFSPNALDRMVRQFKLWEQQLSTYSRQSLTLDQEIDAAMLGSVLQTLREQFELVRTHETQPTFYLTIIGIGVAEAFEAGTGALNKRLKSLPRFIDQAIHIQTIKSQWNSHDGSWHWEKAYRRSTSLPH